MIKNDYLVYLTIYRGNKMPMFYIGSSNYKSIDQGYNGSVKSKKYRTIWERERKENPHMFKTIPLVSRYKTDKEAKEVEYRLQKALNAHKNPMYINESLATINGFMGRNVSGKDNPFYGKTHSDEFSIKHSARMSGTKNPMYGRTGDNCPNGRLIGKDNPFYGKTHSKSTKIVCGIKK